MNENPIIDRLNKFLENHVFSIQLLPDGESPSFIIDVKLKVTGKKQLISVGEWTDYYTYTIFIEKVGSKLLGDIILKYFDGKKEREMETNERDSNLFYSLRRKTNSSLSGLFDYFGIEESVIATKAVNNLNPTEINESLIIEGRYDGITRVIVRDIIKMFKKTKVGEFSLPEDLGDIDEMTYDFGKNLPPFSVTLKMIEDEGVDDFEIDGEYYRDDETIVIEIVTNPNTDKTIIQNMIGELNETVRHELEHIKQNMLGYKRKKEPKNPLKYYTQKSEIEAQIAGFKRRAKQEKKDIRDIANDWFKKYQKRHNLTPKEIDKLKKKLFGNLT